MSNFFKNPFKKTKTDFWKLLTTAYLKNQELQEELTNEQKKSEGLQVQLSMSASEKEELLKQKDELLKQNNQLRKEKDDQDAERQTLKEELLKQKDNDLAQARELIKCLEKELSCQKRQVEDKSKNIWWLSEALRDAKKQLAELNKADLLEQTLKVKLEKELAKREKHHRDIQRLLEQFDVEVKKFRDDVILKEQDIKSLKEELKEEKDKTAGLYKLLEQKELCLNNNVELLEKKSSENEELREALQTEREKREEERKEKEREREQAEEREREKEEEEREKEEKERKQAKEREREKKDKEREEERNEKEEREDDRRKWEEKVKVREEKIKAREEAKRARQETQQRHEEEMKEKKKELEQRLNRLQTDNLWDDGEYY